MSTSSSSAQEASSSSSSPLVPPIHVQLPAAALDDDNTAGALLLPTCFTYTFPEGLQRVRIVFTLADVHQLVPKNRRWLVPSKIDCKMRTEATKRTRGWSRAENRIISRVPRQRLQGHWR